jgi:hypothetical protein
MIFVETQAQQDAPNQDQCVIWTLHILDSPIIRSLNVSIHRV